MHLGDFYEDDLQGKLNDEYFVVFIPYLEKNKTLPSSFSIQVYVCEKNFEINFTKIDGLLNNPFLNNELYLGIQDGYVQLQNSSASVSFIFLYLHPLKHFNFWMTLFVHHI